jgi:hypothetical protein
MNDTESAEKRLRAILSDVSDKQKSRILQGLMDNHPDTSTGRAAARLMKEVQQPSHASPRNKMASTPAEK